MKLVYIANVRMPTEKAHGIQIVKMCEAFAASGLDVTLVVPRRRNHLHENIFDYYGIRTNFTVVRVPTIDLTSLIPFGHAIQTFFFLLSVWLYSLRSRFDLVYTREQFVGLFLKNAFLEIHWFPRTVHWYHRYLWSRVRGFVAITLSLRDCLEKNGISVERILVVPDGVDLSLFNETGSKKEARNKLGLAPDAVIALYAGHLYPEKGAHILAQAAPLLPESYQIVFVGGTDTDIESFRTSYGTHKNIQIVGRKKVTEVPFYLTAADVLVLPNTGEKSGSRYFTSPMKLFEYMASGRPIIASDLPSLREILNEQNAFFVTPHDPSALAEGIKKVVAAAEDAEERARHARLDVEQYTWSKRAGSIKSFIQRNSAVR